LPGGIRDDRLPGADAHAHLGPHGMAGQFAGRDGYKKPTLCESGDDEYGIGGLLLKDSGHLQEEETARNAIQE